MITEEQYANARKLLDESRKPMFLFDDDPDGTCAFLLLYRYKKEGKGMPVKSIPIVDEKFVAKVREYDPDLVFILDMPMVKQEFLDEMKCPVVWIDHHEPQKRNKVIYLNPRIKGNDNWSTTVNAYNIVKQDIWIAMMGAVGDWQIPHFAKEFSKQYPNLLDPKIKKPDDALFETELGKLVKMISFILKGHTSEVMKCIKIFTRIEDPYEILKQTTPRGKYIYKRYLQIKEKYDELLKTAIKNKTKDKILLFTYTDANMSFTKEMSNELLHRFPSKIIILGRVKSGEYKLSLRAKKPIRDQLKKALEGVNGYGGGHEMACGTCIKEEDFERFLEQFKAALKE